MARQLTLSTTRIRLVMRDAGEQPNYVGSTVIAPDEAADVARRIAESLTADEAVEVVLAVMLDARHRVTGFAEVARGTLNAARMVAADVIRPVIMCGAAGFIVTHNHPSGDPTPSPADRVVTRALRDAAELVGVRLIDHIIVGDHEHYSFRDAQSWDSER